MTIPTEVYFLSLVPALLWGFEPIVSKRAMAKGGDSLQASLVVVVVDSAVFWVALVALEGGNLLADLSRSTIGIFLFAGFVGTAVGRLAAFGGIRRVGASVNNAGVSARPLFSATLAVFALDEPLSLATAVGVLVLVAGLAILALAKGGDLGGWEPRELSFPLVAAAAFAVGNVVRRFGLETTPATALEAVALNETAALVALAGYALARNHRDVLSAPRKTYGLFAVSGLLTAVALLSLFSALALPEGRVAIVDPLTGTAPLFTTLFAYFLLRDVERVTRGIVAGAMLVVVGAGIITAL
ncbi:EamA family transporter [Haladaptatus pallidirubidus]|uniref:EamA domain-containing protein n=1 Tax=Haladaptatus pallidirubidus TaxID=1008152 RepID=A0AAV3UMB6_9EURY|nr:DMT family transporter [Haladaptatus pallidirubidus]